jgi:hypothetical protein
LDARPGEEVNRSSNSHSISANYAMDINIAPLRGRILLQLTFNMNATEETCRPV